MGFGCVDYGFQYFCIIVWHLYFLLSYCFSVTSHLNLFHFQTLPALLSPIRLLPASSFLMSLLASPSALSIFPSPGIAAPVSFPLP